MEDPEREEGMRSERNEWQSQPQNWKLKRKDNEGRKGGTRTKRNGNPGIADGSLILLFYTAKISARPCINPLLVIVCPCSSLSR